MLPPSRHVARYKHVHADSASACSFRSLPSDLLRVRVNVRRQERCASVQAQQNGITAPVTDAVVTRRQALNSVATIAGSLVLQRCGPACASPNPAAGAAGDVLPLVPHTALAPTSGIQISKVIKGCWQLSGGHKGERDSDRTGGNAAVQV